MMRTTFVPLRNLHVRPSFWGVERNLQDVMETIENAWEGNKVIFNEFKETNQAYLMSVDLPGINKKDLEIQVEDDFLHISATRKMTMSGVEGENLKKISRSFSIPKFVDKDKIQAHCEDGVLYLALPKVEKTQPKKVEISDNFNNKIWNNFLDDSKKIDLKS